MGLKNNIMCSRDKTCIFFAGQAGFLIKNKESRLLAVDLYLSDAVEKLEGHQGYKRLMPKLLSAEELIIDFLIATHPHFDHFDVDSMKKLTDNGVSLLCASVECQKYVDELQIDKNRVKYVAPNSEVSYADFQVDFVACDHGKGAPDAVGVIIHTDGFRIYMAGDTCYHEDWVNAMKQRGPFDIIIGPINGAYGNMNEKEFARYSTAIGAKRIIPCHYGMFADHGGNPGVFLREMSKLGAEDIAYLMMPGEGFELKENGYDE